MKTVFLVDGDNNINYGLRGIEMLGEENQVLIFHSKAMEITKFQKKLSGCKAKIDFIESVRSGKNSVDFQITTELGFLSQQRELEYAYIISGDKGYDAAVDYVKNRYCSKFKELDRRESIFDCFRLSFLLKTRTKQELSNALIKEYGTDHGELLFNHLKSLFEADVTEEKEKRVKIFQGKNEPEEKVEETEKVTKEEKVERKREVAAAAAPDVFVLPVKMQETGKSAAREEKKGNANRRSRGKGRSTGAPVISADEVKLTKEKSEKNPVKELVKTVEKQEEVQVKKSETIKNPEVAFRFDTVRTEEQKEKYYQSRDLRKKKKTQDAVSADGYEKKELSEDKREEKRREESKPEKSVKVEKREKRESSKNSDGAAVRGRSSSDRTSSTERKITDRGFKLTNTQQDHQKQERVQERKVENRHPEGKVVPMNPASNTANTAENRTPKVESGEKRKVSGETAASSGILGRVFGRKKRK